MSVVTRVDFVAVPSVDWKRSRAFFEDPDGNAPMLHHRYTQREEGSSS